MLNSPTSSSHTVYLCQSITLYHRNKYNENNFKGFMLLQVSYREGDTYTPIARTPENRPSAVNSPDGYNSHTQSWARPKPDSRKFIWVFHMSVRSLNTWTIFCCFPRLMNRELRPGRTQTNTHMGYMAYWHCNIWGAGIIGGSLTQCATTWAPKIFF